MPSHPSDYRVIRSLAVTANDVVMAYETNRSRRDQQAVIRVTPPFNGRMRARLHLVRHGDTYDSASVEPLHIDPAALVTNPHAYPHATDTEAELRADPSTPYSVDAHYEYHRNAISAWRSAVSSRIGETVTLSGRHGPHTVLVKVLGKESGNVE
ncbi:hypothetical protein [Haladaptatus sp. DYSN1]|uniref:hypothetical protein n=1 Tax=unclassified Haladaptatus TaxID=2622732 RepID=UPI002404A170|nr:hypothetical protein [Haladaptatus sp. DYSN1]